MRPPGATLMAAHLPRGTMARTRVMQTRRNLPKAAALFFGMGVASIANVSVAALVAHEANSLMVHETITAIDADTWNYKYRFVNDNPSPIWNFLVYTNFEISWRDIVVTGFPEASSSRELSRVYAAYDARNIDPDLTHMWSAYYLEFGTVGLPSGSVATLSVNADVLDVEPKLYAFETVASGHAGWSNGPAGSLGRVAGFGYTVAPEPTSLVIVLMALLLVAPIHRHR
jgi:hypothetical protein